MGKGKKFFMYLVLSIASIVSVFPLYYMFCASTNRSIDVIAGKLIPGTYLVENFKALIAQQNLRLALWNSFRNATILTILCLLVCSIAGYGFEIYHDKAKDAVFTVLLTAMMIPFAAIMIPMFRMFSQLKMVNTMAAFMLPSISTPFMIMMFRQNSRNFPVDIMEAARIDGSGEFRTFLTIAIPMCKPAIAVQAIFAFVQNWNNFYTQNMIIVSNEKRFTMPIMIQSVLGQDKHPNLGAQYAAVALSVIPIIVIYLILSRFIVAGVALGGVKE